MKRSVKLLRCLSVVVIALLVGVGLSLGTGSASAQSDKVRISTNLPLTGPQAVAGNPYMNGLLMGIDEGAKAAGVDPRVFALDVQSNEGQPKQAVSVLQKQLAEKFDVYISGFSSPALAVAPEIDKLGAPHIILAFDAFIATDHKNRIRLSPHYKLEGPIFAAYAKRMGAKRVAILTMNWSSMFEEYSKIVEPELEKAGVKFTREAYDIGTKEYGPIALKAATFKPDLVMVSGFSFNIYPLLKALRSMDLIKDGSVVVTMDFIDLLYNKTPREELVGVAFTTPHFELPGVVAGAAAWIARYKKRFSGKEPSYIGAYGYDTGRIIVAAYKKAGKVTTKSLLSVLPYDGVTGRVTVDNAGDLASTLGLAKVDKSGQVQIITK